MNEILRTLKLAISVCALPIVATAVVSAQNLQQPSALNQVAANEINQDLEEVDEEAETGPEETPGPVDVAGG